MDREQMVAILATRMDPDTNDAEAHSVWEYLLKLALGVWSNGEGFSGKRPFGNSGWEGEVVQALASRGLLTGKPDEDGYLTHSQQMEGEKLVAEALALLTQIPYDEPDDADDSIPEAPNGVDATRWTVYHEAQRCLGMAGEPRDVLQLAQWLHDGPGF